MVAFKEAAAAVLAIALLIIASIWLFGNEQLVDGVKKAVNTTVSVADKFIGLEEEKAERPGIPAAQEDKIKRLKAALQRIQEAKGQDCVANYGGFSSFGDSTSILLEHSKEQTTAGNPIDVVRFKVKGGPDGAQELVEFRQDFNGLKLCVISGATETQNFYYRFLENDASEWTNPTGEPYFKEVETIQIGYLPPSLGKLQDAGNIIRAGIEDVDEESDNLEDEGWIFSPDGQHVCFFPTKYDTGNECDYESDGLQNSCFSEDKEHSVLAQVTAGNIAQCVGQKQILRYDWIELVGESTMAQEGQVIPIANVCPEGAACPTSFSGKCDMVVEENYYLGDFSRMKGCLARATDQTGDTGCAIGKAKQGSIIPHKGAPQAARPFSSMLDVVQESVIGSDEVPPTKLLLQGDFNWKTKDESSLFCGNDGLWYVCSQAMEGRSVQQIQQICVKKNNNYEWVSFGASGFYSENYFPGGCSDGKDNDQNGQIDCEDTSCSVNLACRQEINRNGQLLSIQKKSCFDTQDNEVLTAEDGTVVVANSPGAIDCEDLNCDRVEYKDQKCIEKEAVNLLS